MNKTSKGKRQDVKNSHPWKNGGQTFKREPTHETRESDYVKPKTKYYMPEYRDRRNKTTGVI